MKQLFTLFTLAISCLAFSAATASAQMGSDWWMNDHGASPVIEDPAAEIADPNPTIDLGNGSTVTGGITPSGVPILCVDTNGDGDDDICYPYPGGTIDSVDEVGDWMRWQTMMLYHLRALYGLLPL